MAKKHESKWGLLLKDELRTKGISMPEAAKNASIAESTLRSWANGHREPNIGAFLRLCKANEIDPIIILFGDEPTEKDVSRRALRLAAKIDAIKDSESGKAALVLIERTFIRETTDNAEVERAYKTSERPRIRGRLVTKPTLFKPEDLRQPGDEDD
jgi:transcriptional regulator with XRE-family HTH domain